MLNKIDTFNYRGEENICLTTGSAIGLFNRTQIPARGIKNLQRAEPND